MDEQIVTTPQRVRVAQTTLTLPTYEPLPADPNPMFLEKRVYQGSSGKVYPLAFTDRISDAPVPRAWKAIVIENDYLAVTVLPEIGGRIHRVLDKTTNQDLVYYQHVIKPALVGLAGPWISGGIEFNWPQHHRPATYMPTDVTIESHADGSQTVWCGDHDPMSRMMGTHGVCLHPDRAYLELKVRLYNRTPYTQTFLWWANVAVRVHEHYQSFFPPDVYYVADHAKRATSRYPLCDGVYYGVDYGRRARQGVPPHEMPRQFVPTGAAPPNDLSWYANIPTPCSYMCMGTKQDFFGGYDHAAGVGLVHVANHHIAPGKKQWTWGNHEFGYAWDRNLTDPDERGICHPYIELMAGVYTDNQPDFSFLSPGETKTFSQFWYPLHRIGPARQANLDAAVTLSVEAGSARLGVSVTRDLPGARIELSPGRRWTADLRPGTPFLKTAPVPAELEAADLSLVVRDAAGNVIITYRPRRQAPQPVPPPATEPPAPADIATSEELYLTGLHLEQYRHATRMPEAYWREALRRDPGDARCNTAMGNWHLRRGEFEHAERHFRAAIERLTFRNPNPADGESLYGLGLALRFLDRHDEAYDALYKATWNFAWQAPAFHALAEIDALRGDWASAAAHLDRALRRNQDNLRARNLKALALRHLGQHDAADELLRQTLALQPLDWWARHLSGAPLACDASTCIDIALDYARAGQYAQAIDVLRQARPSPTDGTAPMLRYHEALLAHRLGKDAAALRLLRQAQEAPPQYCFPARLEDIAALHFAIARNDKDPRAPYYLGNLLYDRRRHEEAIGCWERAIRLDPRFATAWRNLGVAYFNVRGDGRRGAAAYAKALAARPGDARLLYERDQLSKRLGAAPSQRLKLLERHLDLVRQRDDLSVELCALYNQTGRHEQARALLAGRKFQPWEGGEGLALEQHVRTHLALGIQARARGDAPGACKLFEAALDAPQNLGEARHLLANQSNVHYYLGTACRLAGDAARARHHLTLAAQATGDFRNMQVQSFSDMTYYSAMAARALGREAQGRRLLEALLKYARALARTPAKIDYFATSLPTMLLFEDDLQKRQRLTAWLLEAQALLGLGRQAAARARLQEILRIDPSQATAFELLEQARPRRRPAAARR